MAYNYSAPYSSSTGLIPVGSIQPNYVDVTPSIPIDGVWSYNSTTQVMTWSGSIAPAGGTYSFIAYEFSDFYGPKSQNFSGSFTVPAHCLSLTIAAMPRAAWAWNYSSDKWEGYFTVTPTIPEAGVYSFNGGPPLTVDPDDPYWQYWLSQLYLEISAPPSGTATATYTIEELSPNVCTGYASRTASVPGASPCPTVDESGFSISVVGTTLTVNIPSELTTGFGADPDYTIDYQIKVLGGFNGTVFTDSQSSSNPSSSPITFTINPALSYDVILNYTVRVSPDDVFCDGVVSRQFNVPPFSSSSMSSGSGISCYQIEDPVYSIVGDQLTIFAPSVPGIPGDYSWLSASVTNFGNTFSQSFDNILTGDVTLTLPSDDTYTIDFIFNYEPLLGGVNYGRVCTSYSNTSFSYVYVAPSSSGTSSISSTSESSTSSSLASESSISPSSSISLISSDSSNSLTSSETSSSSVSSTSSGSPVSSVSSNLPSSSSSQDSSSFSNSSSSLNSSSSNSLNSSVSPSSSLTSSPSSSSNGVSSLSSVSSSSLRSSSSSSRTSSSVSSSASPLPIIASNEPMTCGVNIVWTNKPTYDGDDYDVCFLIKASQADFDTYGPWEDILAFDAFGTSGVWVAVGIYALNSSMAHFPGPGDWVYGIKRVSNSDVSNAISVSFGSECDNCVPVIGPPNSYIYPCLSSSSSYSSSSLTCELDQQITVDLQTTSFATYWYYVNSVATGTNPVYQWTAWLDNPNDVGAAPIYVITNDTGLFGLARGLTWYLVSFVTDNNGCVSRQIATIEVPGYSSSSLSSSSVSSTASCNPAVGSSTSFNLACSSMSSYPSGGPLSQEPTVQTSEEVLTEVTYQFDTIPIGPGTTFDYLWELFPDEISGSPTYTSTDKLSEFVLPRETIWVARTTVTNDLNQVSIMSLRLMVPPACLVFDSPVILGFDSYYCFVAIPENIPDNVTLTLQIKKNGGPDYINYPGDLGSTPGKILVGPLEPCETFVFRWVATIN